MNCAAAIRRSTTQTGKSIHDTNIVTNVRHYEALTHARASLEDVKKGLRDGISGDLVALDIRQSLHYLGEITGEVSTDDLLDSIFSNFCIGK